MIHSPCDVIDRHDVDPAALEPEGRHPGRQHAAHFLDQLEEIVRSVDLVDLAGLRVTDHDAGPINAPGNGAGSTHEPLGFVLASEIRVLQAGGFLEHVLAERALVEARSRDRRGVVEALGLHLLGQLDGMFRPADVRGFVGFGVCRQVVDGGQVEEMPHLAVELLDVGLSDAQRRLGKVSGYRHQAPLVIRPALRDKVVELLLRASPDQNIDRPLALDQLVDQVAADKSGSPGHEIAHCGTPSGIYCAVLQRYRFVPDSATGNAPLTRFGQHARKTDDNAKREDER